MQGENKDDAGKRCASARVYSRAAARRIVQVLHLEREGREIKVGRERKRERVRKRVHTYVYTLLIHT
jgi:hypothetical protein